MEGERPSPIQQAENVVTKKIIEEAEKDALEYAKAIKKFPDIEFYKKYLKMCDSTGMLMGSPGEADKK